MLAPIPFPTLHFTERKFCSRTEDSNYNLKPRYHAEVLSYFAIFHPPTTSLPFHSFEGGGVRKGNAYSSAFSGALLANGHFKSEAPNKAHGGGCAHRIQKPFDLGENDSLWVLLQRLNVPC